MIYWMQLFLVLHKIAITIISFTHKFLGNVESSTFVFHNIMLPNSPIQIVILVIFILTQKVIERNAAICINHHMLTFSAFLVFFTINICN